MNSDQFSKRYEGTVLMFDSTGYSKLAIFYQAKNVNTFHSSKPKNLHCGLSSLWFKYVNDVHLFGASTVVCMKNILFWQD